MKQEYNIALVNGTKFYPLVRKKWLFFHGPWKRIATHHDGFGLYPFKGLETGYPKQSEAEAQDTIDAYRTWRGTIERQDIVYKKTKRDLRHLQAWIPYYGIYYLYKKRHNPWFSEWYACMVFQEICCVGPLLILKHIFS